MYKIKPSLQILQRGNRSLTCVQILDNTEFVNSMSVLSLNQEVFMTVLINTRYVYM